MFTGMRPGLGHSYFFGDALGSGKLMQARGCPSHQGGRGDVVGVVAFVEILANSGLGQGDDPGTGYCLLGDVQHFPSMDLGQEHTSLTGASALSGQERGATSGTGAWT